MAIAYGAGDRPAEDLTARARIVDVALAQFAERGPTGTTMRSIADGAGVSVGLVQHHFGTKDGLRQACDERVLALVRTKMTTYGVDGGLTDPGVVASLLALAAPVMPYVARAALGPDERSASLFDEIAALTAEWMTSQWPDRFPAGAERTRAAAAAQTAMEMGRLVLHHHIARHLGLPDGHPVPSIESGVAALDVYHAMGEIMASPYGQGIRAALAGAADEGHDRPTTERNE